MIFEILGGIDLHENLLGGLNFAIQRLNWVQMSKIIIHLADAPPHGREFGDYGDNDPDQTIHQYPTVEVSRIIVSSPLVKKEKNNSCFNKIVLLLIEPEIYWPKMIIRECKKYRSSASG